LTYLNGERRSFGAEGFCLTAESEDGGRRSLSYGRSTTVGFQKIVEEGETSVCVEKGYCRIQKNVEEGEASV